MLQDKFIWQKEFLGQKQFSQDNAFIPLQMASASALLHDTQAERVERSCKAFDPGLNQGFA
jgi:hypothetical protein